jgi:hypothetical protein
MLIRMTFEVDSERFGKFNRDDQGNETTLDVIPLSEIATMARIAASTRFKKAQNLATCVLVDSSASRL